MSKTTTPPTSAEIFTLRKNEADVLVDGLRARGFLAFADYTGVCHRDDSGDHWHPYGIVVKLTAEQAARMTR